MTLFNRQFTVVLLFIALFGTQLLSAQHQLNHFQPESNLPECHLCATSSSNDDLEEYLHTKGQFWSIDHLALILTVPLYLYSNRPDSHYASRAPPRFIG